MKTIDRVWLNIYLSWMQFCEGIKKNPMILVELILVILWHTAIVLLVIVGADDMQSEDLRTWTLGFVRMLLGFFLLLLGMVWELWNRVKRLEEEIV